MRINHLPVLIILHLLMFSSTPPEFVAYFSSSRRVSPLSRSSARRLQTESRRRDRGGRRARRAGVPASARTPGTHHIVEKGRSEHRRPRRKDHRKTFFFFVACAEIYIFNLQRRPHYQKPGRRYCVEE